MRTLRHLTTTGLAAVLPLALALTGCAEPGGGGAGATLPDPQGSWAVESLTSGGRTLHAPAAARLDIGADRAKGNYGCNGFTAALDFSGTDAVTVKPGAHTETACENSEFEAAFAKLFTGRLRIDRGPDRLTLKTADGSTIALTSGPADPDAPLTATEWTVDGLLGGGSASSLPAGTAGPARFTIAADGAASGTLGCNRFSAKATVDGPTVTFGPLTTTRMACAGAAGEVERTLTALLAGGPLTWKTEGRALTLTAPDGKGLTAKAASATE